jgi:hypothetical protein
MVRKGNGPGRGGPARGKYEPFTPGHERSTKHGAWSESDRYAAPIAAVLEAELPTVAPWTAAPAFTYTVKSWAHQEALAVLIRRWLDKVGTLDENGQPRPAVNLLGTIEGRLVKLRNELGLSPMALGKLLTMAATTASVTGDEAALEALRSEGRRIINARPELQVIEGEASGG